VDADFPEVGQDNFISKRTVLSSGNPKHHSSKTPSTFGQRWDREFVHDREVRSADRVPIEVRNYPLMNFHHPAKVTESGLKRGLPAAGTALKKKVMSAFFHGITSLSLHGASSARCRGIPALSPDSVTFAGWWKSSTE